MTETARKPVCSVVIPCFDAAATIAATLLSARQQTVRDIEIIVVDDGSRDTGPDYVSEIRSVDSRVRLISQKNSGVSVARNVGIDAAKSRIIAFLDADDLWSPDHLQSHIARIRREPMLGVSYSPARFIDMQGALIGQSRPKLTRLLPADVLRGNPTTTCSTLVVRREVFSDVGAFRTDMRHNEDLEWLFRVSLSGWTMAGDPVPSVDYRTSPNGLASDLDGMYRGFLTMLAEAKKLAPKIVERNAARATSGMERYLARRAVRLGFPPEVARGYILSAIRRCPSIVLFEPTSTLPTLAAALLPRGVILPVLRAIRPHTAHA